MPSARHAHFGAVAGPNRRFNVATRAAAALVCVAVSARADTHGFEPPATGIVLGLELGVLAASAFGAHESSAWAWSLGFGAGAGLGAGLWAGSLERESTATATLRAATLGFLIPAVVLLWSHAAEPPSPEASEDASPLARPVQPDADLSTQKSP